MLEFYFYGNALFRNASSNELLSQVRKYLLVVFNLGKNIHVKNKEKLLSSMKSVWRQENMIWIIIYCWRSYIFLLVCTIYNSPLNPHWTWQARCHRRFTSDYFWPARAFRGRGGWGGGGRGYHIEPPVPGQSTVQNPALTFPATFPKIRAVVARWRSRICSIEWREDLKQESGFRMRKNWTDQVFKQTWSTSFQTLIALFSDLNYMHTFKENLCIPSPLLACQPLYFLCVSPRAFAFTSSNKY